MANVYTLCLRHRNHATDGSAIRLCSQRFIEAGPMFVDLAEKARAESLA